MSKNNGQSRSRRSQPSKPYDVSKSFVKRVASKVSSYIPHYLRSTFFRDSESPDDVGSPAENVPEVEQIRVSTRESQYEQLQSITWMHDGDETSAHQTAPPPKRARTEFQEQTQFLDVNNISVSTIKNDIDSHVTSLESRVGSLKSAGGVFSTLRGPASSSTPLHHGLHFGSNILGQPLTKSAHMEPQPGPSGLQSSSQGQSDVQHNFMPPPAFVREGTQINGDDLSDSSESTSGCSSLVPQGDRHDTEQPKSSAKIQQKSLNSSGRGLEQRSHFARCDREQTLPQPAASNKRPAFDISIISPQARPSTSGEKLDVTKSPFYAGKTCYGGASAYRKLTITPNLNKSYDSVNHSLSRSVGGRGFNISLSEFSGPRRIRISPTPSTSSSQNASVSESSPARTVAKRILDAIESCSSPVSDCSRIPLNDSGLMQKRKRPAEEDLYEYRSPQMPRVQGPPITPLQVPGVQELLKMKRQQAKLQESIEAARKRVQSQKKRAWQNDRVAYTFRNDDVDSSQHTNKIKGRQRDDMDEMPEHLNLPEISLPITSLPKIDLGPSAFAKSSTTEATTPVTSFRTSAAETLPEGTPNFTFSRPIVVQSLGKNNADIPNKSFSAAVSEPLKFSWPSQSKGPTSNVSNIPKDSNNLKSVNNIESKHKIVGSESQTNIAKVTSSESPKVTNTLADMFKPAPGTWVCEICDVRNKSETTTCVACTTPKSGSSVVKTAPVPAKKTPLSQPPLTSQGFGSQFSNVAKWECSGCMLWNQNCVDKCPSCTTPKPSSGTQSKTTATSLPPVTPLSGFGDKFKKSADSWECSVCLVVNKKTDKQCVACNSHQPGASPENLPIKSNKLTFSFGVQKSSASADLPKFKFGVEPEANSKISSNTNISGVAFSFGVQATTSSSTVLTTSTPSSSIVTSPGFTFGVPSMLPDKSTSAENIAVVPTTTFPVTTIPFASPSTSSLSMKKTADSEPKGFQFGSTANPDKAKESPKISFPSMSDTTEHSSPKRDHDDEPLAKKLTFGFGYSTTTTEVTKTTASSFTFGKPSITSASSPEQPSSNFTFTPSSSSPKRKEVPATTTVSSDLFSFGTASSTTVAGTGFSSPIFGTSKSTESQSTLPLTKSAEPLPVLGVAKCAETQSSFGPPKPAEAPPLFGGIKTTETSSLFGGAKTAMSSPLFGVAGSEKSKETTTFGSVAKPTVTTESPKPFSFGTSAFGSPSAPSFGLPATTTSATPSFGVTTTQGTNAATSAISTPMFGSGAAKPAQPTFSAPTVTTTSSSSLPAFISSSTAASSQPMFSVPSTTFSLIPTFGAPSATITTTAAPLFGSVSAPIFGAAINTTSSLFGAPSSTSTTTQVPAFGTSNKSITFGDASKPTNTAGTSTLTPFTFSAKPISSTAASNTGAPPPYSFASSQATVVNTTAGGFAFGSNAGAPVNTNAVFNFNPTSTAPAAKQFSFGGSSSEFPAVKPPEPTPAIFGSNTIIFGATQTSTPTPSFGTHPFGDSSTPSFPTPNFGFVSTPATFGFTGGQSTNTTQNPAPGNAFVFGQQSLQQQQSQPSQAAATSTPRFNPNVAPSFNFTAGGNASHIFQATPTTGAPSSRKYKKATRRTVTTNR